MNITILTVGSRGDVQPYIALGLGLQAAGHRVTLATNTTFADFVSEHGLPYVPLRADYLELAQTRAGRQALSSGGGKLALMKQVMPLLRRILDDAWEAVQAHTPEALVYHPKVLAGYHLAEKLGVPGFVSLPAPILSPTRAFPNPVLLAGRSLGGPLNALTYTLLLPLMTAPYSRMVNAWRRETLGLSPRGAFASELARDGRPVPVLYAFSPHVVPVPPDWPATTVATGYWFLHRRADWQPPRALADFIEAGPPPVYVGFGSMTVADPAALTRLVLEALRQAGLRGVLAAGWGGLQREALPGDVFALEAAPHDWLFPRMAAVVHHGGAGTTAASLRAGRPTIVCPFFGDQAFWGERVFALGAGPRPIAQKALTAEKLAAALRAAAGEPRLARRAADLAQMLQAERGVDRAAEVISRAGAGVAQPLPADLASVRR
jgi:sterol 3beta-glucosyltransferase